jgi:hypothetical protein
MSMLGDLAVEHEMRKLQRLIKRLEVAGKPPNEILEAIKKDIKETVSAAKSGFL